MSTNPPNLRPDLAPNLRLDPSQSLHNKRIKNQNKPTIGMVSLGCPKALVDSERIPRCRNS